MSQVQQVIQKFNEPNFMCIPVPNSADTHLETKLRRIVLSLLSDITGSIAFVLDPLVGLAIKSGIRTPR